MLPLFSGRLTAPGLLACLALLLAPFAGHSAPTNDLSANRAPKVAGRPAQLALAALVAAVVQSPVQAVGPAIAMASVSRATIAKAPAKPLTVVALAPEKTATGLPEKPVLALTSDKTIAPDKPAVIATVASATMAPGSSPLAARRPLQQVDVLFIGDSMSVGGFGDSVHQYLSQNNKVASYASCGSSPESWLKGEPDFTTRCGYKSQTPLKKYYTDFDGKTKPAPMLTPKLEDLIAYHQPTTVIVQLGTNWMDAVQSRYFANDRARYVNILNKFALALRGPRSTVKQVIWITPPDSSRYSGETERKVNDLINESARENAYVIVNSSTMTHYVAGKTGGDGVHYREKDALAWAQNVEHELSGKIGRQ